MLLDSNIVIYAAEPKYNEVREFISQHKSHVSVISKVEVLGYHLLTIENKNKLETLFNSLTIISLDNDIIAKSISLRQERKMSLGDSLIASTSLLNDLTLVTANVKDFSWIDNLQIINPLEQ